MTNKDYKRLTIWNEELQRPCMSADSSNEQTVDIVARHVDRLYELENAIENGTLVFLPDSKAQSEAVKEFAEKLKKQIANTMYCRDGYIDYDDTMDVIDELLKEFLEQ